MARGWADKGSTKSKIKCGALFFLQLMKRLRSGLLDHTSCSKAQKERSKWYWSPQHQACLRT